MVILLLKNPNTIRTISADAATLNDPSTLDPVFRFPDKFGAVASRPVAAVLSATWLTQNRHYIGKDWCSGVKPRKS
jgi:hypothetical protein